MYKIYSEKFLGLVFIDAQVEELWRGGRWLEGPVYNPAMQSVMWSDIPNDRILSYSEIDHHVTEFAKSCGHHNGHAIDHQGRIIACEHSGRRISRLSHAGKWETLVGSTHGKRLNSPNDVVVKRDGSIWFTDPTYGIDSDYLGDQAKTEIGYNGVYRYDPVTGTTSVVVKNIAQPNGLAFSPDERLLYISDSGMTHDQAHPATITAYTLSDDGRSLTEENPFATCAKGVFDGFRVDNQGNIFTSFAGGVAVYDSAGTLLGDIVLPECVTNLCFGGLKRNRLYITTASALYAVYVNTSDKI